MNSFLWLYYPDFYQHIFTVLQLIPLAKKQKNMQMHIKVDVQ